MAKLKFQASGGSECQLDMTPMIDVTFQLIAFFMFVLNVHDAEQNQILQLPVSEVARPPEHVVEDVRTVHITKPEADGRAYVLFHNRRYPLDSADFTAAIQNDRQFLEYQRKTPSDPNVQVVIRGDAAARHGDVRQVIEKWRNERFVSFPLRMRQEREP